MAMELLKKAARLIKRLADIYENDRVGVYAAEASFFVLLSFIPFVMLFILTFGAVYPLDIEAAELFLEELLPRSISGVAGNVLDEVFGSFSVPLISVTSVTLLWAASRGIRGIGDGIQNIFDEDYRHHYIKNIFISFAFTLLFILIIAVALLTLVFGTPLANLAGSLLNIEDPALFPILNVRNLVFFPTLTFLFALAYHMLAKSDIPFRRQFFGAAIAAGGWLLYSFFFALYVEYFSDYSYIYGSLAVIPISMLWLYSCMNILLIGAVINKLRWSSGR